MANDEFYIGWQAKSPPSYTKHVKKVIIVLLLVVVIMGISLPALQKHFSDGNFEFGKLSSVKGVYHRRPVPMLQAISGKDIFGNSAYITIPLVGFGKFGAQGLMDELAIEKGIELDGKEITLKGTLLYNDGKLLMQVDKHDNPLEDFGSQSVRSSIATTELGTMNLKGEIVDPKCFFGVMKPGLGKPHKDCAIRCILGGIPPMLKVRNDKGQENFYLIVGPRGERMNEALKDFIAEPVSIQARAVQQGDWILLYIVASQVQSISRRQLVYTGSAAIACAQTCPQ